jgi:hypothetical protein
MVKLKTDGDNKSFSKKKQFFSMKKRSYFLDIFVFVISENRSGKIEKPKAKYSLLIFFHKMKQNTTKYKITKKEKKIWLCISSSCFLA